MCLICDRIGLIRNGENPFFVREMNTGYVVIGDHQHFMGYTLFLCKRHVSELHELDRDMRINFLREMSLVQEAVALAFQAEKMNCELLGNGDSHLHWHLFPRREGDIGTCGNRGKGPVWWYPPEKMYDDGNRPTPDELNRMRALLLEALDNITAKEDSYE